MLLSVSLPPLLVVTEVHARTAIADSGSKQRARTCSLWCVVDCRWWCEMNHVHASSFLVRGDEMGGEIL